MYFMSHMIAYHCVNFDADPDPDPDAYYFFRIFVLLIYEQI